MILEESDVTKIHPIVVLERIPAQPKKVPSDRREPDTFRTDDVSSWSVSRSHILGSSGSG